MKTAKFTPKRGRPSTRQVLAIDRAILATARRILLGEGFEFLSMDAVASELGISKGTLYARHPSKEALTQAVIKEAVEGWSTQSARHDHRLPEELEPRLKEHLRLIGKKMNEPEPQAFYRLWRAIQQPDPELARIFHDVGFLRGVAVIASDIERAGARDNLPPRDATKTATLLLSALTGWFAQEASLRTVSPDEIDAAADGIVTIFMQGRSAW